MQVKVSETLSVETVPGPGQQLRIVRVAGGLVAVHLHEVCALVAALSELGGRLAADSGDASLVFDEDLF